MLNNRAGVRREERKSYGQLVFGMNQSLDGYVDHMAFAPSPTIFRYFIEEIQGQAGSLYRRQLYEVMRYWDEDMTTDRIGPDVIRLAYVPA